jgi:hypothetical protein
VNSADQAGRKLEARDGIEPSVKVLQTYALPLGYRAPEIEEHVNHIIASIRNNWPRCDLFQFYALFAELPHFL